MINWPVLSSKKGFSLKKKWAELILSAHAEKYSISVCVCTVSTYLPPISSQRCCIVENVTFPTVPQEKYCTKRENCSIKTKFVDIIFQYYVCDVM